MELIIANIAIFFVVGLLGSLVAKVIASRTEDISTAATIGFCVGVVSFAIGRLVAESLGVGP